MSYKYVLIIAAYPPDGLRLSLARAMDVLVEEKLLDFKIAIVVGSGLSSSQFISLVMKTHTVLVLLFLKFCIALPFTWKIHCPYHLLSSAKIKRTKGIRKIIII